MTLDLKQHLIRQMVFSRANFGPGARTKGIIDHIREELDEVLSAAMPQAGPAEVVRQTRAQIAEEWADLVILSLDGLTRAIWSEADYAITADIAAEIACDTIVTKQGKNERRDWPDWRKAPKDKAINHVRGVAGKEHLE